MAASAATAYDPAQDARGSENSDVELDAEHPVMQLIVHLDVSLLSLLSCSAST